MKSTIEDDHRTMSTRDRILRGAATAATERGLRAVTVQDVLEAASVARRTFYQYFPSTEGVLCDLYIEKTAEILERVRAAVASQRMPQRRLRAAMDAYVDALHADGPLLVWLQGEAACPGSMLAPFQNQVHDSLVAMLADSAPGSEAVPALLLRGLLLGADGLMLHLQRGGALSEASAAAAREVVGAMVAAAAIG